MGIYKCLMLLMEEVIPYVLYVVPRLDRDHQVLPVMDVLSYNHHH
jgi:hypothetical protein